MLGVGMTKNSIAFTSPVGKPVTPLHPGFAGQDKIFVTWRSQQIKRCSTCYGTRPPVLDISISQRTWLPVASFLNHFVFLLADALDMHR